MKRISFLLQGLIGCVAVLFMTTACGGGVTLTEDAETYIMD